MIKLNLNKSSAASSGRLCALKRAAALITAAILVMVLTACPNNAGGSGSGSATPPAPPDVGSFEDTGDGFIKIIPPANGIVGVAPDYALHGSEDWWKGVFIDGRKVKIKPLQARQDGGNIQTVERSLRLGDWSWIYICQSGSKR